MLGAYRPVDADDEEPAETETQEGSDQYEDQPQARIHPATPSILIDPEGPDDPNNQDREEDHEQCGPLNAFDLERG